MVPTKKHIIDKLGIITSGLCAIHCIALPLLLSFGIIGGFNDGFHDTTELVVIIVSTILALWSIYNGLNGHGRLLPQLFIALGATIILIGALTHFYSHAFMAFGGLLLVVGHWRNWRALLSKERI